MPGFFHCHVRLPGPSNWMSTLKRCQAHDVAVNDLEAPEAAASNWSVAVGALKSFIIVLCSWWSAWNSFFLLKSMKVESIVSFSRFTWIERSKYMFGSWPFFMMKACDFVNSSNARHGNRIPWLSCLHDPTAPHTNNQRIDAVLVIHRASRLGRKGISDYALTRTERLRPSATSICHGRAIFGDVWQP